MWLVVCFSVPILTCAIKLSRRIVSLLCPASPIVLPDRKHKEKRLASRLATPTTLSLFSLSESSSRALYPLFSPSIPPCPHYEQSCPLYALAIPKPDVCFLPLLSAEISLTPLPSTRSDNGRTSTPRTQHCVAYAALLHFPYLPQPFRHSLCFTIQFPL